jgi:hypothetical protein
LLIAAKSLPKGNLQSLITIAAQTLNKNLGTIEKNYNTKLAIEVRCIASSEINL